MYMGPYSNSVQSVQQRLPSRCTLGPYSDSVQTWIAEIVFSLQAQRNQYPEELRKQAYSRSHFELRCDPTGNYMTDHPGG
jgi:hypothetical protein